MLLQLLLHMELKFTWRNILEVIFHIQTTISNVKLASVLVFFFLSFIIFIGNRKTRNAAAVLLFGFFFSFPTFKKFLEQVQSFKKF